MKRLDVEPTEEVLLNSVKNNQTGRNDDIVAFIKTLADTEGPYSYMIDAAWGDGKTFFLKSVELMLNELNPIITNIENKHDELKEVTDKLDDADVSILPFYFNAWDNDFAKDPITALFACMAAEFDRSDLLKTTKARSAITAIVDAGLAVAQVPLRVSGTVEALTSESLISAFKSKAKIRSRINELAEAATPEVANKLVIFIDELDRCRPDFAVRLLEQTKNLFTSENIILVFATDSVQLAKAVGGVYGHGFDTSRFLERFFDLRLMLAPVDSYTFVNGENDLNTSNRFDKLANELIHSKTFTIRDMQRIKIRLDSARKYCHRTTESEFPHQVALCTVLPLLIFIEKEDMALLRKIVEGNDYNALYEFGKEFVNFNINVEDSIRRISRTDTNQDISEEKCKAYIHDLCRVIYGPRDSEYYDAQKTIGGHASPPFNARVYKQLKFD